MINNKTILVTGATGFIGNYLIADLLNAGYRVIASSLNKDKAKSCDWFSHVTYIPFDITKYSQSENLYTFFNKPDLLIHLAWSGLPDYNSLHHVEDNLMAHYFFCKNLIINGLKDLTVTGTCMEYGMKNGELNEENVTSPSNSYSVSKATLHSFLKLLKKDYNFQLKWLRLFYSYGNGQHPNSLYSQLRTAVDQQLPVFNMSKGDQIRDFLPIQQMAEYIMKAATQDRSSGVINICSNSPITVLNLVENLIQQNNWKIKLNTGFYPYSNLEPMYFWGDNSKLLKILNNE
jgi:dTDP-6-deoxy-L-talose 4-dehydrogenase (NAD+)